MKACEPAAEVTVWPLFAELVRRHDITREECIVYGVIVALTRSGMVVTAHAIADAMATAPTRKGRDAGDRVDDRHMRRRLTNLVARALVQRRRRPGLASHYVPVGPL